MRMAPRLLKNSLLLPNINAQHKVTCIQDDLGQQVVEESGREQFECLFLVCSPDDSSQNKAQDDEQTTLWDHTGDMMV